MKQKLIAFAAAVFLLAACNNEKKAEGDNKETASAENKTETSDIKKDAPAGPPDSAAMAAMQKAWMDFATPGDMHKWMAKSAGTWSSDSVAQWMDPAAPPTYNKASSVEKVIMNGLYMEGSFTSNMMGMPMTGKSLTGYDKAKKKFVTSWIDNMGSGIVRMEGTYDEATKTLNMKGKQSDPGTGGESDIRQEQKWIDDNTYVLTMYGTGHDGVSEQKFMQGTFKRKK
jgi:hypothetical protein